MFDMLKSVGAILFISLWQDLALYQTMVDNGSFLILVSCDIAHPLEWIILMMVEGFEFSTSLSLLSEPANSVFETCINSLPQCSGCDTLLSHT